MSASSNYRISAQRGKRGAAERQDKAARKDTAVYNDTAPPEVSARASTPASGANAAGLRSFMSKDEYLRTGVLIADPPYPTPF